MAGATVDAIHARKKDSGGSSLTGDCRYSVVTDEAGKYSIHIPGSLKYGFRLIAHDGARNEWRGLANGLSEIFDLKTEEIVEDVTIRLTKPCTLQGVVVDKSGKTVQNATVLVKYTDGHYNRYYRPETKSDDN